MLPSKIGTQGGDVLYGTVYFVKSLGFCSIRGLDVGPRDVGT